MSSGRTFVLLVVAGSLGVGCRPPPPTPPLDTLQSAPAAQTLEDGTAVSLYAVLWRDFMPISPSDGKPMIGTFEVRAVSADSLPGDLSVDAAFVVFGDQVWASWPQVEKPCSSSACVEAISREGPKWGPDVTVDVVLQIASGSGSSVLLRQPEVMIRKTM